MYHDDAHPPPAYPARPDPGHGGAAADARMPHVDALRLVSVLLVLATHVHHEGMGVLVPGAWWSSAWTAWAHNGTYGVTVFFAISGLVITRTLLRRHADLRHLDLRDFYVRRAARIAPLWLVSIAVGAVLAAALAGPGAPPEVRRVLDAEGSVRDGVFWLAMGAFAFNWVRIARSVVSFGFGLHWDVMWSLAIEEQFYLLYPHVLRRGGGTRHVAAFLVMMAALGVGYRALLAVEFPSSYVASMMGSFNGFEGMAWGALAALWLQHRAGLAVPSRVARVAAAASIAVGVGVHVFTTLDHPWHRVVGPTCMGIAAAVFMVAGASLPASSSPGMRALARAGRWTYAAYLLHGLVMLACWPVARDLPAPAAFALVATVTLLVSGLVHITVERPAEDAIRRAGLRPRVQGSVP